MIFISGEYRPAARGEQLRQPEGAADGVAQARARPLQGHRAGAHQRTAPAQKVITRVTVYRQGCGTVTIFSGSGSDF